MKRREYLYISIIILLSFANVIAISASPMIGDEYRDYAGCVYPHGLDTYSFQIQALSGHPDNMLASWIAGFYGLGLDCYLYIIPAVFTAMAAVCFYLIAKRLEWDEIYAFLSTLILLSLDMFIGHTFRLDTNPMIHFFILFSVLMTLEMFHNSMMVIPLALSLVMFAYTWNGWFISVIIIGSMLFTWAFIYRAYITSAIVILFGVIAMIPFKMKIYEYLNIGGSFILTEEMRPTIIDIRSGIIVFLAFIVFLWYLVRCDKLRQADDIGILGYFFAVALPALNAYRHSFYAIPPLVMIACLMSYNIYFKYKEKKILTYAVLAFVIVSSIGLVFRAPYPHVDDTLYDASVYLYNAYPDKKIFSWWDYGIALERYSGLESIYKSREPKGEHLGEITYAFTTDDDDILRSMIPDDAVLVVLSDDIAKNASMTKASGIEMTDDSVLYRLVYEPSDDAKCFYSDIRTVCIYEKI